MKNNDNVPKTTVIPSITVDAFKDASNNKKQQLEIKTEVKKN
jgi:hypothetical protein